ncbi:MAG: hypothetical protein HDQ88_05035 [Clostridia bacterium]|nr:hypothetical protein [Clostridia bacterium]
MWTQLPKPWTPDMYQNDTDTCRVMLNTTRTPRLYTVMIIGNFDPNFPGEITNIRADTLDEAKEKALQLSVELIEEYRRKENAT